MMNDEVKQRVPCREQPLLPIAGEDTGAPTVNDHLTGGSRVRSPSIQTAGAPTADDPGSRVRSPSIPAAGALTADDPGSRVRSPSIRTAGAPTGYGNGSIGAQDNGAPRHGMSPSSSQVSGFNPQPSTHSSQVSGLRFQPSPILTYDGGFNGFLCCLNRAFSENFEPEDILPQGKHQPSLFSDCQSVSTSEAVASTAWSKVAALFSRETQRNVVTAFAAGDEGKEKIVHDYLKYGLQAGKDLDKCHSITAVRAMHELVQKVRHEAHRLKGLLRFRETEDGIFYGPFESDNLVICQLASFFKHRLNDQRWVLHDIGRGLMIYWDGEELREADPDMADDGPILSEREARYQELWRTFFRTVAIKERSKPNLQRQFMPQRYWKYLVEKV